MAPVIALWLFLLASQPTTTLPAPDLPAAQAAPSSSLGPDPFHLYKVGGGVTPPKLITQVEPKYSEKARKAKLSGIALVSVIVDVNGNPQNARIAHSVVDTLDKRHHDKKHMDAALSLDQSALDTVNQYKFSPATEAGKPVAVQINVEINFQIY